MANLLQSLKNAKSRHDKRHAVTGFGISISDGIRYLPAADWDALTAGSGVFMSRAYLRVLEEAGAQNVQQRYALVYRGDVPVAAVAAQSVTVNGTRVMKGKSSSKGSALARKAASLPMQQWEERLLVCGNCMSWGPHGVAFRAGENIKEVWGGVAEALYRIRRADRLLGDTDFVMVKDLPASMAEDAQTLRDYSYKRMDTDPDMVLNLEKYKTYEDYLQSLNSKYRKAAQKLDKDLTAAGYTVETVDVATLDPKRLHALYMQVHDGAPVRLVTLSDRFFPAMQKVFGADFRCTVARRGDTVDGFITTLKNGPDAVGYFIGFDRQANAKVPLYFRLLYAAVQDGIALGARELSLGRTALEPKAKLGAVGRPLSLWARHRFAPLNLVVRAVLANVEHDEPPERNPFK